MPETKAEAVTHVYNHDLVGLYDRINRFLEEVNKSVSAGSSYLNAADKQRLNSYLQAIREYQAFVTGAPQLDLPETSPRQYTLKPAPQLPEPESEICADIQRMFTLARDELMRCQSARQPAGLNTFDDQRLTAIVDKVESYLTGYVDTATPLDLPESAPAMAMTGHGRTGV